MKNFLHQAVPFVCIVTVIVSMFFAITGMGDSSGVYSASVQQSENVYCFINAQPVKEYDVVFTVKIGTVLTNSDINTIGKIKTRMIKRANKKEINYDGLIFSGDGTATGIVFR